MTTFRFKPTMSASGKRRNRVFKGFFPVWIKLWWLSHPRFDGPHYAPLSPASCFVRFGRNRGPNPFLRGGVVAPLAL